MNKVLVTVGTTKFDSLIKYLDEVAGYNFTFQIGNGEYTPKNYHFFRFSENISEYYKKADVIISHAGAGTLYSLLRMHKKVLMVPNLERRDKHQVEIAEYLDSMGCAKWCKSFDEILTNMINISTMQFSIYESDDFFKFDEITQLLI